MRPLGIQTVVLERIEDRTAVAIDGKEAAGRVWLKMRSMARRGAFTPDEWRVLCEDWYWVSRSLDEKHEALKQMRGDPLSLLRE